MKRLVLFLMVFTFFVAMGGVASAVPTIDGDFQYSEWAGHFTEEDWVGQHGYVGPGYGGQEFDVEYLGLYIAGDMVYFGLQTGFNLKDGVDNGLHNYEQGDFFMDFGGDGTWDVGIDYSVSGNEATYSLYLNPSYEDPYLYHNSTPYQVNKDNSSGPFGTFSGKYGTYKDRQGQHYVLEGAFSLWDFSGLSEYLGEKATIHWTMSCGNDVLEHTTSPVPTPEPATMLLFGTGLIGLAGLGRKKLKKR